MAKSAYFRLLNHYTRRWWLNIAIGKWPIQKIMKTLYWPFERGTFPVGYVRLADDEFSPDHAKARFLTSGGPIILAARQSESEAGTSACDGLGLFEHWGIPKNWHVNGKMMIAHIFLLGMILSDKPVDSDPAIPAVITVVSSASMGWSTPRSWWYLWSFLFIITIFFAPAIKEPNEALIWDLGFHLYCLGIYYIWYDGSGFREPWNRNPPINLMAKLWFPVQIPQHQSIINKSHW